MHSKSDVLHIIPQFYEFVLTQFQTKIKAFQTNNAPELDFSIFSILKVFFIKNLV